MKTRSEDSQLVEIKESLRELYGEEAGTIRFVYLRDKINIFLKHKPATRIKRDQKIDRSKPYSSLKGKVYAISYPDSVYNDHEYPLKTLGDTLQTYFPSINGIHILPERTMSHGDIWPQDFFRFYPADLCIRIIDSLKTRNIIDENRYPTDSYESNIGVFLDVDLKKIAGRLYKSTVKDVRSILNDAFNSHFNDGGFSQKTREKVDPRFGENKDLIALTKEFSVMLDYVVNHLDVDNEYLEGFRKGNNRGEAFVIVNREEYKRLLKEGTLAVTFRPRPFPLFTGMRKYPGVGAEANSMNRVFVEEGLAALDLRLVRFLSIFFKIENDQGLTSDDQRILDGFHRYTKESQIDTSHFWLDSPVQDNQKIFNPQIIDSPAGLLETLGFSEKYADLFMKNADSIFGEEFYIYTTFSESQADINPLSFEGFKMIVDDLFHLLASGPPSMMRMDAIKYLWKEIGKKNFDMPEGNALIRVIRSTLEITSPSTLPLDEVNSPDPVVYSMGSDGGFYYLFGQVNSIPAAFNEGNLGPINHFHITRTELCPEGFLPFIMLSTHDGRSVQGLGVQHENGHVTLKQFYNLIEAAESRGGRLKFRSVTPGEIAGETFRKVFREAGYEDSMHNLHGLFEPELRKTEDIFRLKNPQMEESDFLGEISGRLRVEKSTLEQSPEIDYFTKWILSGKTAYEICSTSRSAFSTADSFGKTLTPEEEARRLALAQLCVLTLGQDVPAIYFNDLPGLENDVKLFGITGKPRDLNRHKNVLDEMIHAMKFDPFTKTYVSRLNAILKLRSEDEAFYPGRGNFEYRALNDHIFMNHPWHVGNHSLILGNIVNREKEIDLGGSFCGDYKPNHVKDQITGDIFHRKNGTLTIGMEPYGYRWLKEIEAPST